MNRASAILGIVGIILLLIAGTAKADMIADSTHPVQFIFTNYNLNYTSNLSNSTETTTTTYLNLSINSSYAWFNMTAPGDLTLSNLTYTSGNWSFNGSATTGTMRVSAKVANASGNYDFKVDGIYQSNQTVSSGMVYFSYSAWSSHGFVIQENTSSPAPPAANGSPSITSYSPADLTPTIDVNNLATFNAGANQSVSWTWTGVTEGAGDGTANSTATQTWATTGAKTVTVTCSNANGSCGTTQWDVTVVSDGGGGGTNYDWLSGTVNVAGATITTNPNVGSTTGGAYSFNYVFISGQTYWINVSKAGYVSNNTQITFNEDHEIWNPNLAVSPTSITTWWNSKTNDNSLTVHTEGTESVEFGLGLATITTAVWTYDGVLQAETSANFTTTLNSLGVHNLSAYGNIPTGTTQTVTWKLLSVREKSGIGDERALLNSTWFDTLIDSMKGTSPDFTRFISAMVLPYTTQLGALFYVFIYILPLVVIWLRQEKALIPAGLLGIFGLLLIPMLPPEWRLLAGLCVILTSVGIVISIFKERS